MNGYPRSQIVINKRWVCTGRTTLSVLRYRTTLKVDLDLPEYLNVIKGSLPRDFYVYLLIYCSV